MTMTITQQIITVAVVVLGTMTTRFLPFLIFPEGKEPPAVITYLGTVLPYAVIGLLVVYCSGTAYCYWISNFVLGNRITFWPLMVTCFFLPLPGDLALCVVSALLGKRLIPHLRQYRSR